MTTNFQNLLRVSLVLFFQKELVVGKSSSSPSTTTTTTQSPNTIHSTTTSTTPSTTATSFNYSIRTSRSSTTTSITSTTTTIAFVSNPSTSSDTSISPKQVNMNHCSDNEHTDRVAGLTAAVIVLAIILALSLVAIVFLIVYIIRQKRLDRIKTTAAATNPPEAAMNYEKLRFYPKSSSVTRDYDNQQTQEVRTVADPTYEELRLKSDSNPSAV